MRASTGGLLRAAVVVAVATACLATRPAAAEDGAHGQLGKAPWFPLVDPQVGAQGTFELNTLNVIRLGAEGWRPNRGKYRSLLSRHDFYVTVGRTDLARDDGTSAATSSIVMWSGYASITVGALLFYAHLSPGGIDPGLKPGLICVGGGLAAVLASGLFTGPSVSGDEAEEMARRYNERLKLRLEDGDGEARPQSVQASGPHLLPWTDGRSAGGIVALAEF